MEGGNTVNREIRPETLPGLPAGARGGDLPALRVGRVPGPRRRPGAGAGGFRVETTSGVTQRRKGRKGETMNSSALAVFASLRERGLI